MSFFFRFCLIAILVGTIGGPSLTTAQSSGALSTQIESEDRVQLVRLAELIKANELDDAIDAAIQMLNEYRTKTDSSLLEVSRRTDLSNSTFQYYQRSINELHRVILTWQETSPEALAMYRERVDPRAEIAFKAATKDRSLKKLKELVTFDLSSSVGDDACFEWSGRLIEQAKFQTARNLLLMLGDFADLSESKTKAEFAIRLDSNIAVEKIRFRLCLISILNHELTRAEYELKQFGELHSDSKTEWFGKPQSSIAVLEKLFQKAQNRSNTRELPRAEDNAWRTYGGNSTRSQIIVAESDPAGKATWTVLTNEQQDSEDFLIQSGLVGESASQRLSMHPVVWNETLIWANKESVRAIRLPDGRPKWPFGAIRDPLTLGEIWRPTYFDQPKFTFEHAGVARHTSFVDSQGRFFARMGNPLTASPTRSRDESGFLIGLDLNREGRLLPGFPLRPAKEGNEFEGTPIVIDSELFVVERETTPQNSRVKIHIACYELPATQQSSFWLPKWRTEICTADSATGGQAVERTHLLLSHDEGQVFLNTNMGAVAAIDAEDGAIQWVTLYPRRSFQPKLFEEIGRNHYSRDLSPCLIEKEWLLIAPQDTDKVLALNRFNGNLVWKSSVPELKHLHGVQNGFVVGSGRGVYWLRISDGHRADSYPAGAFTSAQIDPKDLGNGRGCLTKNEFYFPTRSEILVFRSSNSNQTPVLSRRIDLESRGSNGGNLLISGGNLVISGHDRIIAFVDIAK